MNKTLASLYVTVSVFLNNRRGKLQERFEERGAGILEYAGLVILAGAMMAILWNVFSTIGITEKLTTAVNKLFHVAE